MHLHYYLLIQMNNIEQNVIESLKFRKSYLPHFQERRIYVCRMHVSAYLKPTCAFICPFLFIGWTLKDFNIGHAPLPVEKKDIKDTNRKKKTWRKC